MVSSCRIILLCLIVTFSGCQSFGGNTIKAFTTDGCSDFPDGTPSHKNLWQQCCTAHDLKYWAGGTFDERLQADLDLRACVQSVGQPAVAQLMLAGVRVGGSPWWPTAFRWGYGWPYTHGYSALTPEEFEQIREQKERQNLN
jgi:hypothetical protein